MLQIGDAAGYYKSMFDCDNQEVALMRENGVVKNIFSQIEQLAGGDLLLSISGLLTSGQDSILRLYLCDERGKIDFQNADAMLLISDLVLSYRQGDGI